MENLNQLIIIMKGELMFQLQLRLQPKTGITDSLFPKTEELLEQLKFQRILKAMILNSNGSVQNYRTLVDFYFCETFPEWKESCFQFYKDDKLQLKDHPSITKSKIRMYDNTLSVTLKLMHKASL